MITTNQLRDSINQLLVDKLKAKKVYINRCPKDFVRPSYWIEIVKDETEDVNRSTIKKTVYFLITCFIEMDEYNNGDDFELTEVQEAVVGLFRAGYVKVNDRAIKVRVSTGGHDNDRSYVDLQFEYFDDRPEEAEDVPLMGDLDFDLKE